MTDDAKQAKRTDPAVLRAHARGLFISNATVDDFLSWATPRQIDAADRPFATELANREDAKRARLLRRARFPVPKSMDGYDFSNVKLPDGYTREELLSLDFIPRAQDLVFHGRTGRGKTHPATALGMKAIEGGHGRQVPADRRTRAPTRQGQTRRQSRRHCSGTSAESTCSSSTSSATCPST